MYDLIRELDTKTVERRGGEPRKWGVDAKADGGSRERATAPSLTPATDPSSPNGRSADRHNLPSLSVAGKPTPLQPRSKVMQRPTKSTKPAPARDSIAGLAPDRASPSEQGLQLEPGPPKAATASAWVVRREPPSEHRSWA